MIDHSTARQLILDNITAGATERVALADAARRILAEDVISPIDLPSFDQSAVDGYAFLYEDRNRSLKVVGETAAGSHSGVPLRKGEAMRIFTGAIVTGGADTVVMQEYVHRKEEADGLHIRIDDPGLKAGANIRKQGEQIRCGELTLPSGAPLTPSCIGLLASAGIRQVQVYKKVRVGVIVTGNEFIGSNEEIKPGKIFESNGIMLQSALHDLGIPCLPVTSIDRLSLLEESMVNELENNDVLIVTGGVSVGDYDFTRPALENLGFDTVFHKVKQKPGKPILFGRRKDGKLAFGLPGNPRSVMICYYIYVLPGLMKLMGKRDPGLMTAVFPLASDHHLKDDGKTHFITGRLADGQVFIAEKQGSHMLLSMASSNVIVEFGTDKRTFLKGESVRCHIFNPDPI